ncbi:MAG: hypothetical protein N2484_06485 [Clostridia bacterium]|nr:hypothetical protein [Clostridia bacterium]
MQLAVLVITILAAWRWGDWKNWQKYHSTMLFISMANLLYNTVYATDRIWKISPEILGSTVIAELLNTFIVFPLSGLIFLTNFPQNSISKLYRISKFIVIYLFAELIFLKFGSIVYKNGWNIWWSLAWDCMMFPMWLLHHHKPLCAYIVSLFIVVAIVILFPPGKLTP